MSKFSINTLNFFTKLNFGKYQPEFIIILENMKGTLYGECSELGGENMRTMQAENWKQTMSPKTAKTRHV